MTNDPEKVWQKARESKVARPTAIAAKVGLTPQAVSLWKKVPAEHVRAVEDLTGISRHVLREDVFGPAPEVAA